MGRRARGHAADWPVSHRAADAAVSGLDARLAQATVRSDYDFILGLVEETLGVAAFNETLRQQLHLRFLEQLLVQVGGGVGVGGLGLRGEVCGRRGTGTRWRGGYRAWR